MTKASKTMGVQQILLSPDPETRALIEYLCQQSGKLYNTGIYFARQTFFKTGKLLTGKFDLAFEPSVSIDLGTADNLAACVDTLGNSFLIDADDRPTQNWTVSEVIDFMRILLVDDEIELTDPLSRVLTREGYTVDIATDGCFGCDLARQNHYDLLILDWMLPQKSGLEICQELRSHSDQTPILFLTAKDTIDDRVQGLDAGADDYLMKPFELRELLARVRALLRRYQVIESTINSNHLQVLDLELDLDNQLAYRGERMIDLSEKESQLLAYLMRSPGQLLTHDQIHQYLWGEGEQPSSNVLAAQIRLLRRKIETTGEIPLIHTVYGKGYRFGE